LIADVTCSGFTVVDWWWCGIVFIFWSKKTKRYWRVFVYYSNFYAPYKFIITTFVYLRPLILLLLLLFFLSRFFSAFVDRCSGIQSTRVHVRPRFCDNKYFFFSGVLYLCKHI
jgi:hypothetical protein